MPLLLEGDSLEVKAIKLHLAAAKHKVSIAKEHAEWSNYQLDQSKKHLKDTEKKLREAKRRVDILDHNNSADDSKHEGGNNKKRNKTAVSSSTSGDNNQQADNIQICNNVLVEDDTISDEQTLKKCGSCDVEKKRWSYLKAEWDKLVDTERSCQVCTTSGSGGSTSPKKKKAAVAKKSSSKNTSSGPKRIRRKCSAPNCNSRVVQGGVCGTHGAKRKLCSHPGCTNWPVRFASACSMHGPGRKNTQAGELSIKNAGRISSTEETSDNKQEVLQQPPVKKRKRTNILEEEKKAKQLSKSAYDKARREAMKAGTWKPDPRYQPKPKPPPPPQYQLPPNPTTMSSGNTGSSGIAMLAKAAESDLLHSLFQPNTQVVEDDDKDIMDEDTIKATAQLDDISRRSGRKRTPSSKKKGGRH